MSSIPEVKRAISLQTSAPFFVRYGHEVPVTDWWQLCEDDPDASFFATPDWAAILTASFSRFRLNPILFQFDDLRKCVVPAIEVRRLRGCVRTLHSMPFGTYGGVVSPDRFDTNETRGVLDAISGTRYAHTTIHPNPLGEPLPAAEATGVAHVHAPDLSCGWEAWWLGLDPKARYSIRKARKRGVEIRRRMDDATFDTFHDHYTRLAKSWGTPSPFCRRFFRAVWELRSRRVLLWTAHCDGRMLAGVLAFVFGKHVTPFISFTRPDARPLAPTNLLYADMIQWACDEGLTYFNFLGSGDYRGVREFKRAMGGVEHEFHYVEACGPVFGLVRKPVRRLKHAGHRLLRAALPSRSSGRRLDLS